MNSEAEKPSVGICPRTPRSLWYWRESQMFTVAHRERDCSAERIARAIWPGPTPPAAAGAAAMSTAAASTVVTSAARIRRRYRPVAVMEPMRGA